MYDMQETSTLIENASKSDRYGAEKIIRDLAKTRENAAADANKIIRDAMERAAKQVQSKSTYSACIAS